MTHDREFCAYCQADEKYEVGLFQLMEHWMAIYPPEIAELSTTPHEFKQIYYAMKKINENKGEQTK